MFCKINMFLSQPTVIWGGHIETQKSAFEKVSDFPVDLFSPLGNRNWPESRSDLNLTDNLWSIIGFNYFGLLTILDVQLRRISLH